MATGVRAARLRRVRGLPGRGQPDAPRGRRPVPADATERATPSISATESIRRWWRTSIWMCAGTRQEARTAVYQRILERLKAAPSVAAAGAARVTVLSGGARTVTVSVDGRQSRGRGANGLDVRKNVVSHGYLRRARQADPAGAALHARRQPRLASRVAIVSRVPGRASLAGPRAARRNPRRRRGHPVWWAWFPIRSTSARSSEPAALLLRAAGAETRGRRGTARARDKRPSARTAAGDSAAVHDVDPRVAVARPQRLREEFEQSISGQRMMATLVGAFGGGGAAPRHGRRLRHHGARRRTTSGRIGIRLALGARPSSIFGLILEKVCGWWRSARRSA